MYFTTYLYGGAKRPPITTYKVHTAEAAAEAAAAAPAAASVSKKKVPVTSHKNFLVFEKFLCYVTF